MTACKTSARGEAREIATSISLVANTDALLMVSNDSDISNLSRTLICVTVLKPLDAVSVRAKGQW